MIPIIVNKQVRNFVSSNETHELIFAFNKETELTGGRYAYQLTVAQRNRWGGLLIDLTENRDTFKTNFGIIAKALSKQAIKLLDPVACVMATVRYSGTFATISYGSQIIPVAQGAEIIYEDPDLVSMVGEDEDACNNVLRIARTICNDIKVSFYVRADSTFNAVINTGRLLEMKPIHFETAILGLDPAYVAECLENIAQIAASNDSGKCIISTALTPYIKLLPPESAKEVLKYCCAQGIYLDLLRKYGPELIDWGSVSRKAFKKSDLDLMIAVKPMADSVALREFLKELVSNDSHRRYSRTVRNNAHWLLGNDGSSLFAVTCKNNNQKIEFCKSMLAFGAKHGLSTDNFSVFSNISACCPGSFGEDDYQNFLATVKRCIDNRVYYWVPVMNAAEKIRLNANIETNKLMHDLTNLGIECHNFKGSALYESAKEFFEQEHERERSKVLEFLNNRPSVAFPAPYFGNPEHYTLLGHPIKIPGVGSICLLDVQEKIFPIFGRDYVYLVLVKKIGGNNSINITVHEDDAGWIIGREGATIRDTESKLGACLGRDGGIRIQLTKLPAREFKAFYN